MSILIGVFLLEKDLWDRSGKVRNARDVGTGGDDREIESKEDLVPVWEGNILATGSLPKRVLKGEQICPMPGREKDVAMIAVSSPPAGITVTSAAERFSMEASKGEERFGIGVILFVGVLVLDVVPSRDEEVQLVLGESVNILSDPLWYNWAWAVDG
jgi:hypothetical protein